MLAHISDSFNLEDEDFDWQTELASGKSSEKNWMAKDVSSQ